MYSGFKTLIGANVTGYNKKVFPLTAPEGIALPYATYQQIFTDMIKTLDGYEGEGWDDYQFDFYSSTYIGAKTASSEWLEFIKNYSGTIGAVTVSNVEIINRFEGSDYVAGKIRYRNTVELKIYYKP